MTTDNRTDYAEMKQYYRQVDAGGLPETLGELVAERARKLGNMVAGDWFQDGGTLTFHELDQRADCLASSLSRIGLRKGSHIAVMLPNVPETMVVWTAIGRIGAVMVPVNGNYTATELSFVLNDADVQFMIIDVSYLGTLDSVIDRPAMLTDGNVVVRGMARDGEKALLDLEHSGSHPFAPPTPVFGSDLLNIQYTSGTTGFPKGCMLTHDYWIRTGYTLAITRGPDNDINNVLVWAPFFYMDGMWQILSAFFMSATSYVVRDMSLSKFYGWLHEFDIHSCAFPAGALKLFPASSEDDRLKLRYIYAFGWTPEDKREAEDRFGCAARDAYGMTELGTATTTPMNAGENNYRKTCGLPMPDRKLKIMDESGHQVDQGQIGELWVSGPGIMWGYYKRPAANAKVFAGDWFRTGDYFRQYEDGYFHIVGRMKDMVKRSGENIAAREVEAVLNQIDGIAESAVVPVPDVKRGEEVKAYVRLDEGATPETLPPDVIAQNCAEHLAAFKLPRYIEYIADFPRTPSKKIAKQKLIKETDDLITGSFDRVQKEWR